MPVFISNVLVLFVDKGFWSGRLFHGYLLDYSECVTSFIGFVSSFLPASLAKATARPPKAVMLPVLGGYSSGDSFCLGMNGSMNCAGRSLTQGRYQSLVVGRC